MRTESDCLFFTSSGYNQKGILFYCSRCLIGPHFICKKQKWGQWRIRVSLKYFNVPWSAERQKPINLSDNIQSTVASNSVSALFKFICFFSICWAHSLDSFFFFLWKIRDPYRIRFKDLDAPLPALCQSYRRYPFEIRKRKKMEGRVGDRAYLWGWSRGRVIHGLLRELDRVPLDPSPLEQLTRPLRVFIPQQQTLLLQSFYLFARWYCETFLGQIYQENGKRKTFSSSAVNLLQQIRHALFLWNAAMWSFPSEKLCVRSSKMRKTFQTFLSTKFRL